MNPFVAIGAILVVMALAVLATMLVENWRHLVTPTAVRRRAQTGTTTETETTIETEIGATTANAVTASATSRRIEANPAASEGTEPTNRDANDSDPQDRQRGATPDGLHLDPSTIVTKTVPFHTPAGVPEGAVAFSATTIAIRDTETADVLAGLLFAGLASTKRSGADRAAAWVTASATPPSADPDRLPRGIRLRGRPAKVAELLGHHDGGCVWVTLQPAVDIARGLARTPVTQPTFAGLVEWWQCTRTLPAVVQPDVAALMAAAIEAVRPQLDHTPWSEVIGRLHDALEQCARTDEPLLVSIGNESDQSVGHLSRPASGSATSSSVSDNSATSNSVSGGPMRAAPTS